MPEPRVVLGLNAAHDASACLMIDGDLAVAIAEERLSRHKQEEGFPHRAIDYCLRACRVRGLEEVQGMVINAYPLDDLVITLRDRGYRGPLLVNPSHHLLHAYYAWLASGFEDAAILIADGSGYHYGEYRRRSSPCLGEAPPYSEMEEAESQYVVRGHQLELVKKHWGLWQSTRPYYRFPSLGHMYSAASQYIFGHWRHAGKTMGLAPYGDARRFPEPFVHLGPDAWSVDTDWVTRLPPRSSEPAHRDAVCRDLAAKVQEELERAMLHLCRGLHHATGATRLCISGGVGLNSVANGRIARETAFSELFVTPAAGDAGIAIGAALYGYHRLSGRLPTWSRRHDYHGRCYAKAEVLAALEQRRSLVRWEHVEDPASIAAAEIANGSVVGWFQGASEFGPRALGHRSILADPRRPEMKDHLNEVVKFREPFRPYAASVLAECASDYFAGDVEDPYMLVVMPVRADRRSAIPSVCHVDQTCRVQAVPSGDPARFRRLIEEFHRRTGVPIVLNTSFNIRGEPIVETPADALDCFLGCRIDVLYIEDYRVRKTHAPHADELGGLVPSLHGVRSLETTWNVVDDRWAPQHWVTTRTGYRIEVSERESTLLRTVDGRLRVADLAAAIVDHDATAVQSCVATLHERGLLAYGFAASGQ